MEHRLKATDQAHSTRAMALSLENGQHDMAAGQVNDLMGQVNALSGQINALTGERNALVEQVNALTGERNRLVGQVNEITGANNQLTGHANNLTAERNRLVGQVNEITGANNRLTGHVNKLTAERNELVVRLDETAGRMSALDSTIHALSTERNDLTGHNNSLIRECNTLVSQVNMLTGVRNDLNGQIAALHMRVQSLVSQLKALEKHGKTAQPAPTASHRPPGLGHARPRRAKFLIVSNMRSGSTYLQTALGALGDVATDFEIKWAVAYPPAPGHILLDENSIPISDILDRLDSDAPVAGSKLVLDPIELTRMEFDGLKGKLGPDVRVIHLVRRYRDVFLSRRRGAYHRLGASARIGPHIKSAIVNADIGRAASSWKPVSVSPLECFTEVAIYLQNDAFLAQLAGAGSMYLRLDYNEIAQRLAEVAAFVTSVSPPGAIDRTLARPPVEKLPPVAPDRLVANMAQLEPVFEQIETLRGHLF